MADESSEYDVESLRITREEARASLDQQIEALDDIDDKAAHTMRLNVLLLGVVLTLASVLASSAGTPTIRQLANFPLAVGVLTTGASTVLSIWAYTSTSYRTGTGPSDVRTFLSKNLQEDEWLAVLCYSYAAWIERNSRLNHRDGFVLFLSHVSLFFSMGYYAVGIVFGLYFPQPEWWFSLLVVVGLGILMGITVAAVRDRLGTKFVETT